MRTLELLLLGIALLGVTRPLIPPARRSRWLQPVVAGTLLLVTVSHMLMDGPRWQLAPVYLVVLVLLVRGLWGLVDQGEAAASRRARIVGGVGVAAVLVGGGLGWALPVADLPAPPGGATIGTTTWVLTDSARTEAYTDEPDDPRRVVAQAWYPVDPADAGSPAPWLRHADALGGEAASWLGLPPFALGHLGLIGGNATEDAPISDAQESWPVVIYLHGWGGFRSVQADLMESLASRGHVAIALDHTYAAVATRFPDGEVVPIEPSALPAGAPEDEYQAAARRLVRTFAEDGGFLLDHLDSATGRERFEGRLGLERVVLIGHSAGGGGAVRLCADRPEQCAGVVGLDPWVEPVGEQRLADGLSPALLSIRSEEWVGNDNDAPLAALHARSDDDAGFLHIEGTRHRDFTLVPLLSPLAPAVGLSGDTPGRRTHEVVEAYVSAFVAIQLSGSESPLPDPAEIPEIVDDTDHE